jgi:hypothetical protein
LEKKEKKHVKQKKQKSNKDKKKKHMRTPTILSPRILKYGNIS